VQLTTIGLPIKVNKLYKEQLITSKLNH